MTKTNATIYWIATLFVVCIMTISGVLAIIRSPDMMRAMAHLGYPPYFSNLLGVSKLVGVCVLLVPGLARLKEWAYAGFGITILSASYSHLLSGDGLLSLEPLVTFVALIVSYLMRPSSRTFLWPVLSNATSQGEATQAYSSTKSLSTDNDNQL
ncbi:MAG: DoxX family protein [Edaphobacter sp.]|uniref:DoxX family protein n=1 Tax=Edaphobacter sp. TaxID=1934404 RepID=UPI0023984C85|nr:DoxX family protein [Edaphobacter sp.]MDE1177431.1 DoxX family protein [Edaphobacter sp.]